MTKKVIPIWENTILFWGIPIDLQYVKLLRYSFFRLGIFSYFIYIQYKALKDISDYLAKAALMKLSSINRENRFFDNVLKMFKITKNYS